MTATTTTDTTLFHINSHINLGILVDITEYNTFRNDLHNLAITKPIRTVHTIGTSRPVFLFACHHHHPFSAHN